MTQSLVVPVRCEVRLPTLYSSHSSVRLETIKTVGLLSLWPLFYCHTTYWTWGKPSSSCALGCMAMDEVEEALNEVEEAFSFGPCWTYNLALSHTIADDQ